MNKLLVIFFGALAAQVHAAGLLAQPGAKAMVQVDYAFISQGSRDREGGKIEWRINRTLHFETIVVAEKALHVAGLHKPKATDAANTPQIGRDMQSAQARCGNDVACMQREMMKVAQQVQATPALQSKNQDVQAAALFGAPHYQMWKPVEESGRYTIDEKHHTLDTDPLCLGRPHERCTIDESRSGEGATPQSPAGSGGASTLVLEVDSSGKTLAMRLPMPLGDLEYTRVYASDKPGEKSGTSKQKMKFPAAQVDAVEFPFQASGGLLRGEKDVPLPSSAGGGTLHVRWSMTLP
jgi:hypothetical protein